ncbi:hypothetical protein [Actinomadura sp. CNU-125]|uniref:hypothetical protein n=1 Tax=Actinomadura sp. CNU-125 TaxID=1904961 RepID=UPI00130116A0|nr:hypothetical protein [Actinomadura sp. CNU-125]
MDDREVPAGEARGTHGSPAEYGDGEYVRVIPPGERPRADAGSSAAVTRPQPLPQRRSEPGSRCG